MKVTLDTPLFLERSIRKFEKLLDVYELRLTDETPEGSASCGDLVLSISRARFAGAC